MGRRRIARAAVIGVLSLIVAACGVGGNAASSKTIKIAYQDYGTFRAAGKLLQQIKPVFERQHPGWTVQLEPIQASENDYYTKLDLMNRSSGTAPDVMYEDTFLINSDVQAGYLTPLDGYLKNWPDWQQFIPATKTAARANDGKTYGVPLGTDTRGLWYNKQIFAKAGLPVPWQPKTWADVLAAAQAIKQKVPGVMPFEVFSGTPAGEASSFQGFEMLLAGTGEQLYDNNTNKWVAPGKGFTDAMTFLKTVYQQGLAPSPQQELNPNIQTIVADQWLPSGQLGIDLDGNWLAGETWGPGNAHPWPQWSDVMGWTPMPNQTGQPPDIVTLSGGWTLSIGAKSQNKDMAWQFLQLALNKDNSLSFDKASGDLPVRQDIASDPAYLQTEPDLPFWTSLVAYTHYRPAYPQYPSLSNQIQQGMEAVMTGQASPQQAASNYGQALQKIVGPTNVERAG